MDLCKASVHLAGNRNFAVPKINLTVAEVLLLRALHGEASVVHVRKMGQTNRPIAAERDRLLAFYGHKKEHKDLIAGIFANVHMQGITLISDLAAVETTESLAEADDDHSAELAAKASIDDGRDIPGDEGLAGGEAPLVAAADQGSDSAEDLAAGARLARAATAVGRARARH